MKNLKIGITLALKSYSESIWTNGMKQNVLMFAHMLKNSKNNYEVCILNTIKLDDEKTPKPNYLSDLEVYFFDDKYMEMDLIFMMGAQIHESKILKFKEKLPPFFPYLFSSFSTKCGPSLVVVTGD
jgi:hypothetical protein